MNIGRATEITGAALEFARIYHAEFDGFTQSEVAKGTTAAFLLLGEVMEASDQHRDIKSASEMREIMRYMGVIDSEWPRAEKISRIVTGMLIKGKDRLSATNTKSGQSSRPHSTHLVYHKGAAPSIERS